MTKKWVILLALVIISTNTYSQQTLGLFTNTPESFDGYTLFGPQNSKETYLINNCGEVVNEWTFAENPGISCYLLDDGNLLRAGVDSLQIRDWNNRYDWKNRNNRKMKLGTGKSPANSETKRHICVHDTVSLHQVQYYKN